MSTSDKVKAVLSCCGKKQVELADYLGMKKQNLNTKMQRDSWPADDLAVSLISSALGWDSSCQTEQPFTLTHQRPNMKKRLQANKPGAILLSVTSCSAVFSC